ncbi:hypothetical protein Ppa06_26360 [Planomonospora parontospora subsp. parontospora]|uniref:HTH cro/C1-type domain-containing protein n=2 Tax=Planomonospora parontospora TaxID=58119 RepID=A0AA37BEP6_9ACTN|nr:helix-turn-helix transcriptional regulator [Planomonospora parontospora]GGK59934.1 hypothetical protein GCM10010126_19320 [Planomonospora parontospora]GII08838.1 hypothetical protein Ppa06_26360 [Planomonospora parontospora subsp. parontospora]
MNDLLRQPTRSANTPSENDRSFSSRAIVRAGALDDHGSHACSFDRSKPDPIERDRLAATLGALLRSLRAERGLSTRALAARSTVARSTITRLEAGERRPRPAVLDALAFGLDHEHPGPLAELLRAAAGESLRPDTAAGLRRRARRRARAEREVRLLRAALSREMGRARIRARQLAFAVVNAMPVPPAGLLTAAQLDHLEAEAAKAEAMREEGLRLDRRADNLARSLSWPYHPLERSHLERHLEA